MSDQVPTTDPKVATLAGDIQPTADLAKAIIAAIKQGGVAAAVPDLPRAIAVVQKDIADVTAAMPVIKAGWKTSEFWLGTGSVAALAIVPIFTHQPPSPAVVAVVGAVTAVYTVVRGMVKSSAPAPAK